MRGYMIRVGDKEIGPFASEAAAKAEARELRKQDYDVKVVSKTIAESTWLDYIGAAEKDIDLDDDDDDDLSWLNDVDDDDDEGDDDDDEGDDDDDEEIDWEALFGDDDDEGDDDDDEGDDAPGGQHFYFRPRSKKGANA